MIDNGEGRSRTTVDRVADIVAAYVSNHRVAPGDMTALIAAVHASLGGLANDRPVNVSDFVKATLAEISKSIKHDALVSFIDGKSYKSLKRHLRANGMTASEYRLRYGLSPDYPMVSASYSAERSKISAQTILVLRSKGRPVGRNQRDH
ncbi:MucR family transcriptional regulator [Methylobacterium sp. J-067]|uniref:MucR family transcriptional regulator n=1 Tax=Methylobacterium sp. J-067 TaxID=2836648 RepID=UPI00391B2D43